MDDIDFGGGGGGYVTLEGDFGTDLSSMSPGGSGINLPDFGGSVQAPDILNQQFASQLPSLTSDNFGSLPNASIFSGQSQNLIQQQQDIFNLAQDLIKQQPQIQDSYTQYQQAYDANLPLYNKAMKSYTGFMNAYNFNMQQGYGDSYGMQRLANSWLKDADKYKQKIIDAANSYKTTVTNYNNSISNVKSSLLDYQVNYKNFQDEVAKNKTEPVASPLTPPEPVAPDLPEITVNPPEDPKEPVAPDLPQITVTPPLTPPTSVTKKEDDLPIKVSLTVPTIKSTTTPTAPLSTNTSSPTSQQTGLSSVPGQTGSGNIPTPISGQTLAGSSVNNNNPQILQQLQQLDPKLLAKIAPHLSNTNLMQSGLSSLSAPQQSSPQQSNPQQSTPYSSLMQTMLSDKGGSNPSSGLSNTLMSSGLSFLGGTAPGYKKGGSIQHNEHVPEFITGATGHYVKGKGDGQSDDIPAMLADGEYVFDADTVAALGNGSSDAGAKLLDHFRETLREHKRSAPTDKIPPKASPLAYMKEALKRHTKG